MKLKLSYLLFISIFLMSCMSKQDKIKKFVSDYNRIMTDKTPDVTLQFLKAEPIGDNEIKINLQFNSTLNNMQK